MPEVALVVVVANSYVYVYCVFFFFFFAAAMTSFVRPRAFSDSSEINLRQVRTRVISLGLKFFFVIEA